MGKILITSIIIITVNLTIAISMSYDEIKTLFNNQRYDLVIKETTKVLTKNEGGDKTAELYYLRGLAYDAINKITWAIEDYNKAIKIYPGFGDAYVALGGLLIETNELESAENAFNSALELIENEPLALTGLGYICLMQNRTDEAVEYLTRAIGTGSAPAQAYSNLGYIEYTKGNISLAIEYLEIAINKNPTDFTAMFTLGLAYMVEGNFLFSSDYLKKVVDANPEDLEARLALAKSYEQLELKEAAITQLTEALKLSPNNSKITAWLNRLKTE
ncbi:MAG: tetratricopeptide repeat protein [bacterium]